MSTSYTLPAKGLESHKNDNVKIYDSITLNWSEIKYKQIIIKLSSIAGTKAF